MMRVSDKYILVRQTPVPCEDLREWARWFEGEAGVDHRHVFEDTVREHWISTVFLGLDHSFLGKSPPILFETMVFCRHRSLFDPLIRILRRFGWVYPVKQCQLDNEMARYSTWLEAEAGHANMMKHVLEATPEIRWHVEKGKRWLLARSKSMMNSMERKSKKSC